MRVIRKINVSTNYYSDFRVNNFFSFKKLNQEISKDEADVDLLNAAIFHCTNRERDRHNISICEFHPSLQKSSRIHSDQMRKHNFFNHENSFNKKYMSLYDRFTSAVNEDIGFSSIGENIADYPCYKLSKILCTIPNPTSPYEQINYLEFASNVVNGWMNSPGHRKNILNHQFKYLGCGVALYEGGNGLYSKVTQNFGGDIVQLNMKKNTKKRIKIIKK